MMVWQNVRDLATLSHKIMQKTLTYAAIPKTKMHRNKTRDHTTQPPYTAFTALKISIPDATSMNTMHERSAQQKSMTSAVKCTILVIVTHKFCVCLYVASLYLSLITITYARHLQTRHHYLCLIKR
jgi:hypothetical protein